MTVVNVVAAVAVDGDDGAAKDVAVAESAAVYGDGVVVAAGMAVVVDVGCGVEAVGVADAAVGVSDAVVVVDAEYADCVAVIGPVAASVVVADVGGAL